jgi:hypothetical protein
MCKNTINNHDAFLSNQRLHQVIFYVFSIQIRAPNGMGQSHPILSGELQIHIFADPDPDPNPMKAKPLDPTQTLKIVEFNSGT